MNLNDYDEFRSAIRTAYDSSPSDVVDPNNPLLRYLRDGVPPPPRPPPSWWAKWRPLARVVWAWRRLSAAWWLWRNP